MRQSRIINVYKILEHHTGTIKQVRDKCVLDIRKGNVQLVQTNYLWKLKRKCLEIIKDDYSADK